jgi:hypothetical protein
MCLADKSWLVLVGKAVVEMVRGGEVATEGRRVAVEGGWRARQVPEVHRQAMALHSPHGCDL